MELFSELGRRIDRFGEDDATKEIAGRAVEANEWFTVEDVVMAIGAIRRKFLCETELLTFVGRNEKFMPDSPTGKKVAVVMAGNIPAVGFADLLYVLLAGHRCYVKPSSKDMVLIRYLISQIRDIIPDAPLFDYIESEFYDAAIATGSDQAGSYFRGRYAGVPLLSRGSRYSAAVLTGGEDDGQIAGLAADIFSYSGLGCRNVSLLFVPAGFDVGRLAGRLSRLRKTPNALYLDDYRQLRAMALMQGTAFVDGGTFVMKENASFPSRAACVNYSFYDSPADAAGWIAAHDGEIQCVVSGPGFEHSRGAGFGEAQYPALDDFADGRNVVEFLSKL